MNRLTVGILLSFVVILSLTALYYTPDPLSSTTNCQYKSACGSDLENDECGVCGGDNSSCEDCAGVPNGDSVVDNCGTCDNDFNHNGSWFFIAHSQRHITDSYVWNFCCRWNITGYGPFSDIYSRIADGTSGKSISVSGRFRNR